MLKTESTETKSQVQISLIIPIYNEEELIPVLFERCISNLITITNNFEIICIDDGSRDNSLKKLIECHQRDNRFKILVLSTNFGHQSAYTAGLSYSKGNYIVMMDGDLQDSPELIKTMYEKITKENLDVVYVKRIARNENWLKRLLIKIFHNIFKYFSKLEHTENVGNFSIFNRKVLNSLLSIKEKNRYLPGLRAFIGFKQDYITYRRPDREFGTAKMNYKKLLHLAMDAIFSFSDLPIKICLYTGMAGIIACISGFIYTLISKIIHIAPFGWSSLIISIYFLGSVQLLFLGIIGEYIFRIYKETQNRPLYIVDKFIE